MRHFPRFVLVDHLVCPAELAEHTQHLRQALQDERAVELPDHVAHHAGRALRLKDGTMVAITSGDGHSFVGPIHFDKKGATFAPVREESPEHAGLALHLVQAWVSLEKLDWIVEKAVELGATRLTLVPMARSVIKLEGERLQKRLLKLEAIATGAMAQSGRNTFLHIDAMSFKEALLLQADLRLMMSPPQDGEAPFVPQDHRPQSIVLAVGPEGGFAPEEANLLREAHWQAITLGERVLRTETAGMAGLIWAQTHWGDFL